MNDLVVKAAVTTNSTQLTILAVILPFLGLLGAFLIHSGISYIVARNRALSEPPIGFKEGMVFDKQTKVIKGTRTAVHMDYKTGKRFLGKVVIG